MAALIFLFLNLAASLFKPRWRLEAENAALRQQLIVLQRKVRGRVEFTNSDRLFFIQLYRWFPSILKAITTFRPETLVRWHRAGFRRYWRWKSRNLGGRPQIAVDLRALIRRMSVENLLWGAPRIHGELLKLGFAVAQSTVAKYMAGRADPSGQRWSTFLRNHSPHIAAMDLFVVPTIGFNLLYVLVIVRLARRELVWLNVTAHPTAEWIAQQITEAFPWTRGPTLPDPRSRRDLRCCRHAPITSHGHPRQAHCPWLAVAELFCREADRIDPSRMRRPCHRIRRAAFAPSPKILCDLLQQRENAPLIGQRCAGLAGLCVLKS